MMKLINGVLYDTGSTLPTWRLSFTLRILRCRFAATTSWRTRIRSGGTSTTGPTSDLLQKHSASLSKNTTYISSTRGPRPPTKLIRGEISSKMVNKFLFEEKYAMHQPIIILHLECQSGMLRYYVKGVDNFAMNIVICKHFVVHANLS